MEYKEFYEAMIERRRKAKTMNYKYKVVATSEAGAQHTYYFSEMRKAYECMIKCDTARCWSAKMYVFIGNNWSVLD